MTKYKLSDAKFKLEAYLLDYLHLRYAITEIIVLGSLFTFKIILFNDENTLIVAKVDLKKSKKKQKNIEIIL